MEGGREGGQEVRERDTVEGEGWTEREEWEMQTDGTGAHGERAEGLLDYLSCVSA